MSCTLTNFEMRYFRKDVSKKEYAFKGNKNIEDQALDKNGDLDDVEAKFMRRLENGTRK